MFSNAAPPGSIRQALPVESPVSNWSVALYRKTEPIYSSYSYDNPQQTRGSFYLQLQQQSNSSNVLYFRYQPQRQKNSVDSYTLPFTISQLDNVKLSPETASFSPTAATVASSKFYDAEQQTVRKFRQRREIHFSMSILIINNNVENDFLRNKLSYELFLFIKNTSVC